MLAVLVLISSLALASAFPTPGKEHIFDYRARIRVGTYEPVSFASQFILEGKLHIQHEKTDSSLVRFTDLTYKLYNGELNHRKEHESTSLPLPQETVDLLRVFRIEYEDGKVVSISTERGEDRYVVNIKKAIASLLQIDQKRIRLDSNEPHAFITEERSIYGKGLVEYNVIPQGDQVIVQKMQDVKSSRHWYSYFGINLEPQFTGVPANSPVSVDSHRQIIFVRENDIFNIKQIHAHGGIYVHPMNGLIDAQYISVNQTLDLLETIPIENQYRVNNEERTDQLEFRLETETETGVVADLSFGRHHATKDQYIRLINHALDDAVTYLSKNQLTLDAPNIRQGQSINRLQRLVSQIDLATLEQIYKTLKERSSDERGQQNLRIFQQILPLVGTRATVVFIRNLIRENKLDDDLAVELLNKLPFHLRMPSEKLLQEVEDLVDLGKDVKSPLRQAAVLSFASLVHKVFAHKSWYEHKHEHHHVDDHEHLVSHQPGNWDSYHLHQHEHAHDEHHHEEDLKRSDSSKSSNNVIEGNQLLERYILKFVNLLKESQDYSSQFLYMQALYNIQVKDIVKHLEPFVKGEVENSNRHLRFLAICASLVGAAEDPERVFKTYWPIFTNRNLHLELRAGAYTVIMMTRPTMSKLWNIYWFMQSEQCPELYHFYYTHLKSLASTKNPVLQDYKIRAAQILRFVRKPYKKFMSGNYLFDYVDPKYNYGAIVQSMFISTKRSKVIFVDLMNQITNVPLHYYSFYLKIDGLDSALVDKLPQEKIVRYDIQELEQLLKVITTLHESKDLHIEFAVLNHNQVVKLGHYDRTNIKELVDSFQNIQIENHKLLKSSLQIQYNLFSQLVLPNDLGFPTVLQVKYPVVTNNLFNITREIVNKITNINADIRLQLSLQSTDDVGFYNPIADIWQGINRIRSYDQVIPVNLNLALNDQQRSVKLTLNRHQDEQLGQIGVRNHATIQTYVFGDEINNYLKQSNDKCNAQEEVTRGQKNKRTQTLYEMEDENTGLRYQIMSFDSERQVSRRTLSEVVSSLLQKDTQNDGGLPLVRLLLTARNLWTRLVLLPGAGTSGFIVRATPSRENIISHVDLSFRYNQEVNREESAHLPSTRINTRATYSLKTTGDKLVKTWDVNAIVDMNPGHTVNNIKVQISKIVPDEKDYRICIDGIKKWVQKGVTGHLSIAIGRSADNKCVKDEALIEVNMKGENSDANVREDNNQNRMYDECSQVHLYEPHLDDLQISHYHTVDCVQKHTTIRRYEYDIKTTRIPDQLVSRLKDLLNILQQLYSPDYTRELRKNLIEDSNTKVIIEYPVIGDEANVQIMRSHESYKISGIPVKNLNALGLQPDNYHLSQKFLTLHRLGLTKSCVINRQIIYGQNEVLKMKDSEEWIDVIKDVKESPAFKISVRKIQEQRDTLALRIVSQGQTLTIRPFGNRYEILLDEQPISLDKNSYRHESWFSVGLLDDEDRTIVLHVHNFGTYMDYNGAVLRVDVPKIGSGLAGKCLSS